MAEFFRQDLRGSHYRDVDLRDRRLHDVDVRGAVLRGVQLDGVEIDGDVEGLTINGVEVRPLIEAELDRRYPDRVRMRPTDPAGFQEAWDVVERLWGQTVTRARGLDPGLLHESVDGEWSFIETLRHLVMATECWVHRAMLGDPAPWHPLKPAVRRHAGCARRSPGPGGPARARRGPRRPP